MSVLIPKAAAKCRMRDIAGYIAEPILVPAVPSVDAVQRAVAISRVELTDRPTAGALRSCGMQEQVGYGSSIG
jgi:hypothetical protein